MKVTVDRKTFTLVESGEDRWEVFASGKDPLGEVWKGHRTYFRLHKQVQCWKATGGFRSDTRKDAIRWLLRSKGEDEADA